MPDVSECDDCGRTTRGELCSGCKDSGMSLEESIAKAVAYRSNNDE